MQDCGASCRALRPRPQVWVCRAGPDGVLWGACGHLRPRSREAFAEGRDIGHGARLSAGCRSEPLDHWSCWLVSGLGHGDGDSRRAQQATGLPNSRHFLLMVLEVTSKVKESADSGSGDPCFSGHTRLTSCWVLTGWKGQGGLCSGGCTLMTWSPPPPRRPPPNTIPLEIRGGELDTESFRPQQRQRHRDTHTQVETVERSRRRGPRVQSGAVSASAQGESRAGGRPGRGQEGPT